MDEQTFETLLSKFRVVRDKNYYNKPSNDSGSSSAANQLDSDVSSLQGRFDEESPFWPAMERYLRKGFEPRDASLVKQCMEQHHHKAFSRMNLEDMDDLAQSILGTQ